MIKVKLLKQNCVINSYTLQKGGLVTIGRKGGEATFQINDNRISSIHAIITNTDKGIIINDTNSTNGVFINNKRIEKNKDYIVYKNDEIMFGENGIVKLVIDGLSLNTSKKDTSVQDIPNNLLYEKNISEWLDNKQEVIIGRSNDADICLSHDKSVSRNHAKITKLNNNYYIIDLNSLNGTYVNGKRISKEVCLKVNDSIFIGNSKFSLTEKAKDLSQEFAISAKSVTKYYNYGKTNQEPIGLHEISFSIPSKEFVALMGPSGCGKSTLLKALNGDNPATSGNVLIHGLDLIDNYDYLKRKIGYVPQDDIVHKELSVEMSLFYAAKLRMGDNVSNDIIKTKIDEVLSNLNINRPDIRRKKVGELSGGQRKRVSIAVELLNDPTILFLDEPTSPLDPETIEEFLKCIKNLANNGTTIVMVTHKPEDLNYVDTVLLLTTKGFHAYYGNKGEELFNYFESKNIINIYSKLSKEEDVKTWYDKWNVNKNIQNTISKPKEVVKKNTESKFKQLFWLSKRYLNIKMNDTGNMILLLAQPLIISLLLIVIFDKLQLGVLFLLAISAIWFGVSNAAKEIVGEIPIYKRERMFNLNIHTYLLSKVAILSVIAAIQVIIFCSILYFKYSGSETDINMVNPLQYLLFMFYLAVSATFMGLLLSAVFTNTEKVMTFVPIALMPQIMLAGVVTRIDDKYKEVLSYLTLGRWGTEGFCRIQNDYSGFETNDTLLHNKLIDTVFTEIHHQKFPKDIIVNYDTIITKKINSLYSSSPQVAKDTFLIDDNGDKTAYLCNNMIDKKVDALGQLGFYNSEPTSDLIQLFNSFDKNIAIITAINIVVFIGLYIAMKKKDSL